MPSPHSTLSWLSPLPHSTICVNLKSLRRRWRWRFPWRSCTTLSGSVISTSVKWEHWTNRFRSVSRDRYKTANHELKGMGPSVPWYLRYGCVKFFVTLGGSVTSSFENSLRYVGPEYSIFRPASQNFPPLQTCIPNLLPSFICISKIRTPKLYHKKVMVENDIHWGDILYCTCCGYSARWTLTSLVNCCDFVHVELWPHLL